MTHKILARIHRGFCTFISEHRFEWKLQDSQKSDIFCFKSSLPLLLQVKNLLRENLCLIWAHYQSDTQVTNEHASISILKPHSHADVQHPCQLAYMYTDWATMLQYTTTPTHGRHICVTKKPCLSLLAKQCEMPLSLMAAHFSWTWVL